MSDRVVDRQPTGRAAGIRATPLPRPAVDKGLLDLPAGTFTVDHHFVIGDSIAGAVGGELPAGLRATEPGVAWVIYDDDGHRTTLAPLDNRQFSVGAYSPFPAMAQRLFALTGRRSLWSFNAKGNTALLRPASVWGHWDMDHPGDADNMLVKDSGPRNHASILPAVLALRRRFPCFKVADSFVHVALGKTDATALYKRTVSAEDISRGYLRLLEHFRAHYGVSRLFLWTSGRLGNTAQDTAQRQSRKDMAGLRAAQRAAQLLSPDIHVTFDGAQDTGDPMNTLRVDADGVWVSGFELQADGSHYTQRSYDCIAETAARRIAAIIGPRQDR